MYILEESEIRKRGSFCVSIPCSDGSWCRLSKEYSSAWRNPFLPQWTLNTHNCRVWNRKKPSRYRGTTIEFGKKYSKIRFYIHLYHWTAFLLSDHLLCEYCNREKFRLWDFYIFTRFEVSWIHLCYFYGDVCMHVCIWVNTITSKRCIRLSSNLVWKLQVAIWRTLLILVSVGCIVFYRSTKKIFYTLRPKEWNF